MTQAEPAAPPPGTRFTVYAPHQMQALIERMADQAVPLLAAHDQTAIVGVLRRGAPLADRLADALGQRFDRRGVVRLDLKIKRYADDLRLLYPQTHLSETPGLARADLEGRTILLVDDVLYTGHSLFRAVEWLNRKHPAAIHCAVLAHRQVAQLPVRADVVGAHLQVAPGDVVECHVPPYEPEFKIELLRPHHAL